jgi:cytochrome b561
MAVSIHWSSVVLILILIASGFGAAKGRGPCSESGNSAGRRTDRSRGAGIDDPSDRPVSGLRSETTAVAGSPRWQERTAQVVHVFFYIITLGTIASALGMMARSGAAPLILGGEGALLPDL